MISLNISPIKVPQFNFFLKSASLCIPITRHKLIFLFNNITGHPDDPLSVGILCPNSYSFIILIILPHPLTALSPYGYSTEKTSEFLYILYPFFFFF